jgi:hypothetical protein
VHGGLHQMRPWHDDHVLDVVHAKGRAVISRPSAPLSMMSKDLRASSR